MSNVFARLFEEGDRQQQQLQQAEPMVHREEVVIKQVPRDSMTARQQPVETAQRHDSATARQHDSTHEYVQSFLTAKATNKTTLRYPETLMSEVDELVYQIKRTYKVTLSKNEIFVLALAHLMGDFKRNATRSVVYKALIQDQEK